MVKKAREILENGKHGVSKMAELNGMRETVDLWRVEVLRKEFE